MSSRIMGWLPVIVFFILAAVGSVVGIVQSRA
jgi:hypothetical protein